MGRDTQDEITKFMALPNGWHFGEGVGTCLACAEKALAIDKASECNSYVEAVEVFPCISGEIMICLYGRSGDDYIEFLCRHDGTIDYVREIGNEEVEEMDSISIEQALLAVKFFALHRLHRIDSGNSSV